jgi:CMP-N,N'-diacetyllegionaminic acid synthase
MLSKKIIAIIPARAGSKGLKNKNLKKIGNKSLVEISIQMSKRIKDISMVAVSTDSKLIQKIAQKNKVWCKYLRPKKISGDQAKTSDAIIFTLNQIKEKFDYVIEFQPTYVFRNEKIIKNAISLIKKEKKADSLISVNLIKDTSHKDYYIKIKKNYAFSKKPASLFNRHNLERTYKPFGLIIITKVSSLLKYKSMVCGKTLAYEVKDKLSKLDIDDNLDYEISKYVYLNFKKKYENR